MKATVLFASPRGRESNTMALLHPALETWRRAGHEAEVFSLYDLHIEGCLACRCCQTDWQQPACAIDDDMQPIFRSILRSELVLLATPVYSWYCTAPLKAALDRLVYAMDKYYGSQGKGPALLAGKAMAAVVTCGYRPERGADLFLEAMARWCKHGQQSGDGDLQHIAGQKGQHPRPQDGGQAHILAHIMVQDHRHIGQTHGVQHRQSRQTRQSRPQRSRLTAGGEQTDDPRGGDQADEKAAGGLHQIGQAAALGKDRQSQQPQRDIHGLTGRAAGGTQQAAGHGSAEELQSHRGVAQRDAEKCTGGGERGEQCGACQLLGFHGQRLPSRFFLFYPAIRLKGNGQEP